MVCDVLTSFSFAQNGSSHGPSLRAEKIVTWFPKFCGSHEEVHLRKARFTPFSSSVARAHTHLRLTKITEPKLKLS